MDIRVGDTFVIDKFPVRRKWWQFWKPRIVRYEPRPFVVRDVVTGEPFTLPGVYCATVQDKSSKAPPAT